MHNKYSGTQTRYSYLGNEASAPFSALERRSYNHVIEKLNSENEYLSHNVKQLIIENQALKNKLYYNQDPAAAKRTARNDVAHSHALQPPSPELGRRPQHSPLWKKQQQQSKRPDQQPPRPERQDSPGGSELKRETIIEELSESNFQRASFTPDSKQQKAVFHSRGAEKPNKQENKMVRSVDNSRGKLGTDTKIEEIAGESFEKEASETERIVLNQEPRQTNPEKETPSTQSKFKHKKDNSPYLQPANPSAYRSPANESKCGEASRLQKYSNRAYLSAK